jgi:adenylate cyclase
VEVPSRVLAVDDVPANLRLLEAVLVSHGFEVVTAGSGAEALSIVAEARPDIVLLDVQMPGMGGYEVCRRLRDDAATTFLPVVMVTSSEDEDRVAAIEAGADDFIRKPFDQHELLARVRSLVRIKRYHDTIVAQSAELAELNRDLEARVATQVGELERLGRLRRFLSPQLADLVSTTGHEDLLESHRREIAVLFADLRGWTAFSETTEPEEVMGVIREFHATIGALLQQYEATVGWFAGDGVMAWWNDPLPTPNPAARAAVAAVAMRRDMTELTSAWQRRGHQLDFGVGIALGYATLGTIGFEGRLDYGAVGTVMNLASRLCDEAGPGQILMSARAVAAAGDEIAAEPVGDLTLKGFGRPVPAASVTAAREVEMPAGVSKASS